MSSREPLRVDLLVKLQCESDRKFFEEEERKEFHYCQTVDVLHHQLPGTNYQGVRGFCVPIHVRSLSGHDWAQRVQGESPTTVRDGKELQTWEITIGDDIGTIDYFLVNSGDGDKVLIVSIIVKIREGYSNWEKDLAAVVELASGMQLALILYTHDLKANHTPLSVMKHLAELSDSITVLVPASPVLLNIQDPAVLQMILRGGLIVTKDSCVPELEKYLQRFPLQRMLVSSHSFLGPNETRIGFALARITQICRYLRKIKDFEKTPTNSITISTCHAAIRLLPKLSSVHGDYFLDAGREVNKEEKMDSGFERTDSGFETDGADLGTRTQPRLDDRATASFGNWPSTNNNEEPMEVDQAPFVLPATTSNGTYWSPTDEVHR